MKNFEVLPVPSYKSEALQALESKIGLSEALVKMGRKLDSYSNTLNPKKDKEKRALEVKDTLYSSLRFWSGVLFATNLYAKTKVHTVGGLRMYVSHNKEHIPHYNTLVTSDFDISDYHLIEDNDQYSVGVATCVHHSATTALAFLVMDKTIGVGTGSVINISENLDADNQSLSKSLCTPEDPRIDVIFDEGHDLLIKLLKSWVSSDVESSFKSV